MLAGSAIPHSLHAHGVAQAACSPALGEVLRLVTRGSSDVLLARNACAGNRINECAGGVCVGVSEWVEGSVCVDAAHLALCRQHRSAPHAYWYRVH